MRIPKIRNTQILILWILAVAFLVGCSKNTSWTDPSAEQRSIDAAQTNPSAADTTHNPAKNSVSNTVQPAHTKTNTDKLEALRKLYVDFPQTASYPEAISFIQKSKLPYDEKKLNGSRSIKITLKKSDAEIELPAVNTFKDYAYIEICYLYPKLENDDNDELGKYFFANIIYVSPEGKCQLSSYKESTFITIDGIDEAAPSQMTRQEQMDFLETYTSSQATVKYETPVRQASAAGKTPLDRYGRLQVSGANLADQNGTPIQLKGISTHGLSWYPQYVNKKAFRTLRDQWGIDAIRLAMYTAEYNGYCTGSAQNRKDLETLIDKAVQYCDSLGLYAIIDWHILSDSNPSTYQKQAVSFFRKMAKKYAGHDNVLYEICNEPNGDTTWNQIKAYAQTVIRTIRKHDKHAIIITGTPTWSQDVDLAADSPLKGSNLMYAFHFYASTHTQDYRKKLQEAIDNGLPIFVSEFSICEASGGGTINKAEARQWLRLLDSYNISYLAWNLSNKDEASALLQSSCTKTSNWKRSDLSKTGKWLYDYLSN